MPLETATHISQLVATNPAHSDGLSQADSHLRLIKQVLLNDLGTMISTSGAFTQINGTSSAPSYSFASDPTVGFYHVSAGNFAFTGSLTGQGAVAIGTVHMFAGADAKVPTGYMVCDGAAVSRTTYAALFTAIGTTWGAGDGSTTFNLPDLLDRFPRHRNTGTGNAAGAVGNKQATQNASHTHTGSGTTSYDTVDHTHAFSGSTGYESNDHTHSSGTGYLVTGLNPSSTGGGSFAFNYPAALGGSTAGRNQAHTHAFSGSTGAPAAYHQHNYSFTTSTGSADGTEARPVSATLTFIIRVS